MKSILEDSVPPKTAPADRRGANKTLRSMHATSALRICLLYVVLPAAALTQQGAPPEWINYGSNILKVSEATQVAYIHSALDQGMPVEMGGALTMLVLNKSALTLPLIETKIEDVLLSRNPSRCCTLREIDPAIFVDLAAVTIDYAGDVEALRQFAMLLAIDEKRFAQYVGPTVRNAGERRGNPFLLAYAGLQMGSAALPRCITEWATAELPGKTEFRRAQLCTFWAKAMLARYGGARQTEENWERDPLVQGLPESTARALRHDVLSAVRDEAQKR